MVAMTKVVAGDSKDWGTVPSKIHNTREYAVCLTYDWMKLCIHGALWTHKKCEAVSSEQNNLN